MPRGWDAWDQPTAWPAYLEQGTCLQCRTPSALGWCDRRGSFYCQSCWQPYGEGSNTGNHGRTSGWTQPEARDDYYGKAQHDEIIDIEQLAAEEKEQSIKDALRQILDQRSQTDTSDSVYDSEDTEEEDGDIVTPLPMSCSRSRWDSASAASTISPASVMVIMDISGSMRTVDVTNAAWQQVSRLAAVTETLATFFDRQARGTRCPHSFSLITFNDTAQVRFQNQPAVRARRLTRLSYQSARLGTKFVKGLSAARDLLALGQHPGTPHLLIFSDGRPADLPQTLHLVQQMLSETPALRIHAIGFGDGLDFAFLQQLASIGGGTFAPSGRSMAALHQAFASVTSSITRMQTSVASQSSRSSTFTFRAGGARSGEEDGDPPSQDRKPLRRTSTFEAFNQNVSGTGAATFESGRTRYTFDGKSFRDHSHPSRPEETVSMRLKPFTEGGMRLVHCFQDLTICSAGQRAMHMVVKVSRYLDLWHNSLEVVSAYAKSSAAAVFYARLFRQYAADCLGGEAKALARIIFMEACSV